MSKATGLIAELVNLVRKPRSGVMILSSGLHYVVDGKNKTMILTKGAPDSDHRGMKSFMAEHGWTVMDSPDDHPDQMSFAESIRDALLEEGGPFAKTPVILQYRPFRLNDEWKWYWVLLPEDRSKALASGQGDSRAQAAVGARKEARRLKVVITKIDVLKPYEK